MKIIKEGADLNSDKMTLYSFISLIKNFLGQLLINPIDAKPDKKLMAYGLYKSKLLSMLISRNIIERDEKIIDTNVEHPQFKVKYKIPRKNFERKLKRLYIKLFEVNVPKNNLSINEDGEGDFGGATSASVSNDNAPIAPFGQVQRKTIYINNKQLNKLQEIATTFNCGDYQYDVPFMFKDESGKKDDAYIHNKKGGISMDRKK